MGYAVELYFDRDAELRVRELWRALERAGVPAALPDLGARPHVSLAACEALEPESLRPLLRELARAHRPLTTRLSAVGTFPTDEAVVYLTPVVTADLLACHRDLHTSLDALGVESRAYYRPGHWVPHCTVAQDLARDRVFEFSLGR